MENCMVNVGSSINIENRMENYYKNVDRLMKNLPREDLSFARNVLKIGGISNLKWGVLYSTANILKDYMSKYSIPAIDTPVYSNILGHYSKHKVRMVEQSIHAYRLPSWNSDKGVIFDYRRYARSPTAFQDKFGITSWGNVSFFNSQREAISASGIHSRTFTRSVNITPPHYIIAPTMNKHVAIFQDESVRLPGPRVAPSREKDAFGGQISPDHFDIHSISTGKYILIDSTTLKQVGPEFNNSQEAARYIGYSNPKRVRRYINTYYELSGTGEFSKLCAPSSKKS